MKKILIIAYYFPPYSGAGGHRTVRFTKYLKKLGWKICVLTIEENYFRPSHLIDKEIINKLPYGIKIFRTKVLRGLTLLINLRNCFRSWKKGETSEKVNLKKDSTHSRKSWAQSIIDIISSIFVVPDNEVGWLPYAVLKGKKIIRSEGADIIYSSGPPHTCHLIAYCLKKLTSMPWVADFRDPWSRSTWKRQKSKLHHKTQSFLESRVVKSANKIILNTNHMQKEFAGFYKDQPPQKFVAITNGFDTEDFMEIKPGEHDNKKHFTITHTGTLYKKRDPSNLLLSVSRLAKKGIISPGDFQLNFIGAISIKDVDIKKLISEYNIDRFVNIIPPVSHKESLKLLADSDVLLIIQPDTSCQIPGKMFEYIYLRKPILSLSHNGATSDIINKNKLGIVVSPEETDEIEKAILIFYEKKFHIKDNEIVLDMYSGEKLTEKLSSVLSECVKN